MRKRAIRRETGKLFASDTRHAIPATQRFYHNQKQQAARRKARTLKDLTTHTTFNFRAAEQRKAEADAEEPVLVPLEYTTRFVSEGIRSRRLKHAEEVTTWAPLLVFDEVQAEEAADAKSVFVRERTYSDKSASVRGDGESTYQWEISGDDDDDDDEESEQRVLAAANTYDTVFQNDLLS